MSPLNEIINKRFLILLTDIIIKHNNSLHISILNLVNRRYLIITCQQYRVTHLFAYSIHFVNQILILVLIQILGIQMNLIVVDQWTLQDMTQ